MKITIGEDACKKVKLSLPEVLEITLVKTGVNIETLLKQMKEKQILVEEHTLLGTNLLVTQRWSDLSDKALLSADKSVPDNKRLENLAKSLMEVFPAGKKEGMSGHSTVYSNSTDRRHIADAQLRRSVSLPVYHTFTADDFHGHREPGNIYRCSHRIE